MAGPGDGIAAGGCGRLRASHADREQVIGTLKAGFVQGRLAKDEFDLRVGQTFASRTYAELAAVTADLPAGLTAATALSRVPRGVRDAVRYMRLGAVLNLAVLVTIVVTLGSVRSAAVQDAAVHWHTVMATQVVPVLASAAIGAGVWLWLAWAVGRGYNWARFAFAALFGLLTIGPLVVLAEGGGPVATAVLMPDLLATMALWLVALVVVVLIFNEAVSPYYQRQAATRATTPA